MPPRTPARAALIGRARPWKRRYAAPAPTLLLQSERARLELRGSSRGLRIGPHSILSLG